MLSVSAIAILTISVLGYPYQAGVLVFPHDEGAHPADSIRSEWWYNNMMLWTPQGDTVGVMLTYFRKPASARIFNITDISSDTFYSGVDILGAIRADTGHLFVTYRGLTGAALDTFRWTYPADSQAFSYIASVQDFNLNASCSLRLNAFDYPFAIDSTGYIMLGDSSEMSFYYAIPFMNISGTLSMGGSNYTVNGIGWMDRQWGPFEVSPEGGYEWFSIVTHSEDSSWLGVQAWNIFDGDSVPHLPSYRHLNIFYHTPDTSIARHTSNFSLERLGYFYDPVTNLYFSQGWRIVAEVENSPLIIEFFPYIQNQIVTFITNRFYEGICRINTAAWGVEGNLYRVSGNGYAFAELVQKFRNPITPPSPPDFIGFNYSAQDTALLIAWHPSLSGTYPIAGYRLYISEDEGQQPRISRYIEVGDTLIRLRIDPTRTYQFYISAFDDAPATNGSEMVGPFIFNPQSIHESTQPGGFAQMELLSIAAGHMTFNINCQSNWKLTLFSPSGRVVDEVEGHGQQSMEEKLMPGVYIAVLKTPKGEFRRKFVIAR